MSATEILRRLLDEHGVEYETYIEQPTGFEHVKWNFNEHGSADFNLEFGEPWLTMYGVISGPEQAIAATLGSSNCTDDERMNGTCHIDVLNTGDCAGYECSEYIMHCNGCGHEFGHVLYNEDGDVWMSEPPNYCPNCGRRIEQ